MTKEFERVSVGGGKEGKSGQRARVRGASGGWDAKLRAINELIEDMVQPTTEVARVIGAVAKGDLSQSMAVEVDGRPLRGEFLRIGEVVNRMVEQLASFAAEVSRSEEHTSELQSLMRISYAVFCLTQNTQPSPHI